MGHNSPEYIRTVAEAMKYATIDKDTRVGDPAFVDVPLEALLDKAYGAELADKMRRGQKATLDRLAQPKESTETTHVAVFDNEGNAFSMTHTLGAPSGVIPPRTGFMLNGCMGIFDPRPGRPTSRSTRSTRPTRLPATPSRRTASVT